MKTSNLFKITLSICLTLVLFKPAFAQETPKAILNNGDIEHFISSFQPLRHDLNALQVAYDDVKGAWATDAKIKAVFTKHGWGNDFVPKFTAIISAYSYLKSVKEFDKMPADQKQMMNAVIEGLKNQFSTVVNDADIALVKKRFNVVEQTLEQE